jgi:hypothetical protein
MKNLYISYAYNGDIEAVVFATNKSYAVTAFDGLGCQAATIETLHPDAYPDKDATFVITSTLSPETLGRKRHRTYTRGRK